MLTDGRRRQDLKFIFELSIFIEQVLGGSGFGREKLEDHRQRGSKYVLINIKKSIQIYVKKYFMLVECVSLVRGG